MIRHYSLEVCKELFHRDAGTRVSLPIEVCGADDIGGFRLEFGEVDGMGWDGVEIQLIDQLVFRETLSTSRDNLFPETQHRQIEDEAMNNGIVQTKGM